eukprot:829337-Pyramimonas_sp.AAC.1
MTLDLGFWTHYYAIVYSSHEAVSHPAHPPLGAAGVGVCAHVQSRGCRQVAVNVEVCAHAQARGRVRMCGHGAVDVGVRHRAAGVGVRVHVRARGCRGVGVCAHVSAGAGLQARGCRGVGVCAHVQARGCRGVYACAGKGLMPCAHPCETYRLCPTNPCTSMGADI